MDGEAGSDQPASGPRIARTPCPVRPPSAAKGSPPPRDGDRDPGALARGPPPVVIAAVVVAVILVVILAIFLLPKMFHTYKSSADLGPRPAPPPAAAQLR